MRWMVLGIILGACCLTEGRDAEDLKFIAAVRRTKTALSLFTFTTTAPLTCALATNAVICQRRRYRRFAAINDQLFDAETPTVDGSLDEGHFEKKDLDNALPRDPRIALTVVVTSSSTVSITVTSTNSLVTFSLSFFCTVSGASFPPACG